LNKHKNLLHYKFWVWGSVTKQAHDLRKNLVHSKKWTGFFY
jgi:hypothetical protein